MTRQCNRSGCCGAAAATLGYDYGARTAWLVDITAEAHPATYELCHDHADHLNIPMGWALHDQRRVFTPRYESAQAS